MDCEGISSLAMFVHPFTRSLKYTSVWQPLLASSLLVLPSLAVEFAPVQKIEPGDAPDTIFTKAAHVIPTERQLAYHQREFIGFIHFGPNTFTGKEWGNGMEDPAIFAPTNIDTDDWCKHMKAAGITCVVMTFKHHDGYVLWQSRYENHQSIKKSPYKNGTADIARQLSASCAKYGLRFGVYLSPADLYQIESKGGLYGNGSRSQKSVIPTDPSSWKTDPMKARTKLPKGAPTFTFECDDYNRYMLNQLYEMLTEYGPVHEVWFDGATPKSKGGQKYTYADWYALIRKLAPNAIIFGKGPDARWCGNEAGRTRDTEWNVIPLQVPPEQSDWPDLTDDDLASRKKIQGAKYLYYLPCETNTSIRHGWFWRDDDKQTVRGPDDVFDIYERSVGGNSLFMLNIPPNRDGRFSDRDAACLVEVGRRIRATYGKDLAKGGASPSETLRDGKIETYWEPKENKELVLSLVKPTTINRFVIQEAISKLGQRVEQHALDAWVDGAWKEVATGTTIGYKKILRFADVTTDKLRLRVLASRLTPGIAEVSAHFYAQPPLPVQITQARTGAVTLAVKEPAFTGKGGGFKTKGLEIRYTLDGKDPTRSSLRYEQPISMPDGGVVKARSFSSAAEGTVAVAEIGLASSGWKATATSEESPKTSADKAVDGDPSTFWHSGSGATHPQTLTIDLGQTRRIAGFTYLPRQDKRDPNGMIEQGRVEISVDGQTWVNAGTFTFGNLLNDPTVRTYKFSNPKEAKQLRIVSLKAAADQPGAGAAEIGVLTK